jgi:hypothetical protein
MAAPLPIENIATISSHGMGEIEVRYLPRNREEREEEIFRFRVPDSRGSDSRNSDLNFFEFFATSR